MRASRLLPLLLAGAQPAAGKRIVAGLVEGYKEDWKYISHFAFSAATASNPATIEMLAWTFMSDQLVLVYKNDEWFDVYHNRLTDAEVAAAGDECVARADRARFNMSVYKGKFYGEAGEVIRQNIVQDGPAFWFLAVARCRPWHSLEPDSCTGSRSEQIPNGVFMYYELTLKNPGGYWYEQFSADEHGMYQMHIAFMILFALLLTFNLSQIFIRFHEDEAALTRMSTPCLTTVCAPRIPTLLQESSILYLLAACNTLFGVVHVLACSHCQAYADDGIGHEWAVVASEVTEYAGSVLFTLLVLLIAKGWNITRRKLKPRSRKIQGAVSGLLILLFGIVFIVEIVDRDPAATYHKLETAPARVIAVLRLVLVFWFLWCIRRSFHQEDRPQVRKFYLYFAVGGGYWLFSFAFYVAIAPLIPAYTRKRVLACLLYTTDFAAACFLAFASYPRYVAPVVAPVDASARVSSSEPAARRSSSPQLPGNHSSRSVAPARLVANRVNVQPSSRSSLEPERPAPGREGGEPLPRFSNGMGACAHVATDLAASGTSSRTRRILTPASPELDQVQ